MLSIILGTSDWALKGLFCLAFILPYFKRLGYRMRPSLRERERGGEKRGRGRGERRGKRL